MGKTEKRIGAALTFLFIWAYLGPANMYSHWPHNGRIVKPVYNLDSNYVRAPAAGPAQGLPYKDQQPISGDLLNKNDESNAELALAVGCLVTFGPILLLLLLGAHRLYERIRGTSNPPSKGPLGL